MVDPTEDHSVDPMAVLMEGHLVDRMVALMVVRMVDHFGGHGGPDGGPVGGPLGGPLGVSSAADSDSAIVSDGVSASSVGMVSSEAGSSVSGIFYNFSWSCFF